MLPFGIDGVSPQTATEKPLSLQTQLLAVVKADAYGRCCNGDYRLAIRSQLAGSGNGAGGIELREAGINV